MFAYCSIFLNKEHKANKVIEKQKNDYLQINVLPKAVVSKIGFAAPLRLKIC